MICYGNTISINVDFIFTNKSMLIYIRHSEDNTSATYPFDNKLSYAGSQKIAEFTERMIKKRGLPDVIYCGPLRRCKLTCKYMLRYMKVHYKHTPRVKIDTRLSRFFTPKERQHPDIMKTIQKHNLNINETSSDFKHRTHSFIRELENEHTSERKIWAISHTLVIREACRIYSIDFPKKIPFLFYIKVHANK